ncbi:hypothetical protein LQW54_006761 [Pestalotiopsis sp. IQ-011]
MKLHVYNILAVTFAATNAAAGLLPFELDQLSDADVAGFPDIDFGSPDDFDDQDVPHCREYPGSVDWPSLQDWNHFNESLGGALLHPLPPGAVCYDGLAAYVVNATTVKHVQAAVNFARSRNLRLVIRNTGHDFGGRSTGAGALSVWTHYLKEFRWTQEYSMEQYI